MTDNEKAATFIGWKEGMLTRHGCALRLAEVDPRMAQMPMSIDPDESDGATYTAPDMTDPRNYMKALEALATREIHGAVSTTLFAEEGRRFSCVLTRLDSEGSDEDFIRYAASFGEAAVLSLAALYDMEHPKAN